VALGSAYSYDVERKIRATRVIEALFSKFFRQRNHVENHQELPDKACEDFMRILCLGAGAIGGYFGGRLIEAGVDVTFVVREQRQKYLAEHGLRLESPFGDFATPVKAITKAELSGAFDVILLTCKAYDLPSAIETIAGAVGSDTAILPLLNGVAHIDLLNAKFGRARVLGGVAKIAATLTSEGIIQHLNNWRYITFGEQDGTLSPRVLALKAAFDKSSVVAAAVPNIMQIMWEKIVHLSTIAGMTCAMRASVGEIARTRDGARLMIEFLERNAEIARDEGFPPSDKFMEEYRQLFSNTKSNYTASMLRDIERKGPIEADHIIGFMLDRAHAHKIDPALHRIVFVHLQSYEQRRTANRL
jgi:2-dehydropantoate 2-reductase